MSCNLDKNTVQSSTAQFINKTHTFSKKKNICWFNCDFLPFYTNINSCMCIEKPHSIL